MDDAGTPGGYTFEDPDPYVCSKVFFPSDAHIPVDMLRTYPQMVTMFDVPRTEVDLYSGRRFVPVLKFGGK